jgi:hypothetical protein
LLPKYFASMAAPALQPALRDPRVAKAVHLRLSRDTGFPAKVRGGRAATAAAAKGAPRPKQSAAELQNALADTSGLRPKDVKLFLEALRAVAAKRLCDTNVFKLHNIVLLRMKRTSPRNASWKTMFGKEAPLQAKPAGYKITAVATKQFYDAVSSGD